MVSLDEDEVPAELPAPTDKLSELLDRVRRREYKKRTLKTLPFFLTDTMEIAVRLYHLVGATKRTAYTWLNARDNTEAKPVTKFITQVCRSARPMGRTRDSGLTERVPQPRGSRRRADHGFCGVGQGDEAVLRVRQGARAWMRCAARASLPSIYSAPGRPSRARLS